MEPLSAGLPAGGWSLTSWRDRRSAASATSQKRRRPAPGLAGYGAKGAAAGSGGRP